LLDPWASPATGLQHL